MPAKIAARYPGTCTGCDQPIQVGETIQKRFHGNWEHADCTAGRPNPDLPSPQAQLSEHRRQAEQDHYRQQVRGKKYSRTLPDIRR